VQGVVGKEACDIAIGPLLVPFQRSKKRTRYGFSGSTVNPNAERSRSGNALSSPKARLVLTRSSRLNGPTMGPRKT
tara:strand:- start:34 stop:261 length:228 start_codon:yes stop_codon:yes gene_type:complete